MPTPSDHPPRQVRNELAETIEDIGSAMGLLREASDDTDRGNTESGKMCASDALEILSSLETRFSQLAAKIAIWSERENENLNVQSVP